MHMDITVNNREDQEDTKREISGSDHNSNPRRLGVRHQEYYCSRQRCCSNEKEDWDCAEDETGLSVKPSSEIVIITRSTLHSHSVEGRVGCRGQ